MQGGNISMLLNFKVKGYKAFYDEVNFTMEANNYIRKNKDNLINISFKNEEYSVVKSSIIFGPNNTGKSSLLLAFKFMVSIISENKVIKSLLPYNLYNENKEIILSIKFIENGSIYDYTLVLNDDIIINEILIINNQLLFEKANIDSFKEESIKSLYKLIGGYNDKLFVLTLPQDKYKNNVEDFKRFFNRFEFIDLFSTLTTENNILSFMNTYSNDSEKKDIRNIIKDADLSIEDLDFDDTFIKLFSEKELEDNRYKHLKLCSTSTFKDKTVKYPFFLINSSGTNKVAFLSDKINNAIKNNKILIIDDFSDGLHTVLSKNLISYFNSNNNSKAQMIITSQDLLLLDDKYLFRKDQIWFIFKDKDGNYLYSLNDFKDNKEVDARGNVLLRYLKGLYGALPLPNIGGIADDSK